jgi:hypothetical protein
MDGTAALGLVLPELLHHPIRSSAPTSDPVHVQRGTSEKVEQLEPADDLFGSTHVSTGRACPRGDKTTAVAQHSVCGRGEGILARWKGACRTADAGLGEEGIVVAGSQAVARRLGGERDARSVVAGLELFAAEVGKVDVSPVRLTGLGESACTGTMGSAELKGQLDRDEREGDCGARGAGGHRGASWGGCDAPRWAEGL